MTKVQRIVRLARPLDEELLERVAEANSIYGIDSIRVTSSGDELIVEHDATRLRVPDVASALERAGVPVASIQ